MTKERLLETTRHRKHAKPAGLHSEAEQTHYYNKERGVSGSLLGDDIGGLNPQATLSCNEIRALATVIIQITC